MRQRGLDPTFYQIGPVYTPTGDDMLLTAAINIDTEAGDVFKVQWTADCASMALAPIDVDLGLLGVPGEGVQPVSVYLFANP